MEELLEDLIYKSLSSFFLVFGELKSYENSWKMFMFIDVYIIGQEIFRKKIMKFGGGVEYFFFRSLWI